MNKYKTWMIKYENDIIINNNIFWWFYKKNKFLDTSNFETIVYYYIILKMFNLSYKLIIDEKIKINSFDIKKYENQINKNKYSTYYNHYENLLKYNMNNIYFKIYESTYWLYWINFYYRTILYHENLKKIFFPTNLNNFVFSKCNENKIFFFDIF